MTSLISGDAQIGFMGSEASIYVYAEGAEDYVINFAQLTQRAGNFLVSRQPIENFDWSDLAGLWCWEDAKAECPKWYSSIY